VRAQRLAEATRLAEIVAVLTGEAGVDADPAWDLAKSLGKAEQAELLRSYGRVEPRKRFKGGPISRGPEVESNLLYIDESGKSGIGHGEPWEVFSLAGIALRADAASDYRRRADDLKRQHFGTIDFTFHEPDIRRGHGRYAFGGDHARSIAFAEDVGRLVRDTPFTAFGVGVRKAAFHDQFIATGRDPYLPTDVYALAIQMLLERYVDFLATTNTVRSLAQVIFESQGPLEDAVHQRDYVRVLIEGTQWVADGAFRDWLQTGVRFTPKQGSDPMELADMLSRDLYEWVRDDCSGEPGRWAALSEKIYCRGDRNLGKFGVKVFPDADLRDRIDAHRATSGPKN
jgi:hypothetical protein